MKSPIKVYNINIYHKRFIQAFEHYFKLLLGFQFMLFSKTASCGSFCVFLVSVSYYDRSANFIDVPLP